MDGIGSASQLIVDTLASINELQTLATDKGSRSNFLNRAIKREVVFERNESADKMINDLFHKRFCDGEMIFKFQSTVYKGYMELEIKRIAKEIEFLNALAAKKRRVLKSITTGEMFQTCVKYLDSRKAAVMVNAGKENEILWKLALDRKGLQSTSVEKWMSVYSIIAKDVPWDEKVVNVNNLSVVNLEPISLDSTLGMPMSLSRIELVNICKDCIPDDSVVLEKSSLKERYSDESRGEFKVTDGVKAVKMAAAIVEIEQTVMNKLECETTNKEKKDSVKVPFGESVVKNKAKPYERPKVEISECKKVNNFRNSYYGSRGGRQFNYDRFENENYNGENSSFNGNGGNGRFDNRNYSGENSSYNGNGGNGRFDNRSYSGENSSYNGNGRFGRFGHFGNGNRF